MDIIRTCILLGSLLGLVLLSGTSALAADHGVAAPLVLEKQGTFYVGGHIDFRTPNTSQKAQDARSLPGDIAVDQMYVEYQIPQNPKYRYPIVFVHGGGHTGEFFRTTPDGRDGWFTSFTRRGFAVYVVDAPNRGRAGWDPTNRLAVSQELKPPSVLEAANMYSEQSAWVAFRWGPRYRVPYPDTQFPLANVDEYLKQIQPAYRDVSENGYIAADVGALVDQLGPCILLGWSTGTGNVMVAATSTTKRLSLVKAIIGLEGFPPAAGNAPHLNLMAKIPFLGLVGDHTSKAPFVAYTDRLTASGGDASTIWLPDIGLHGNGHTMAIELNNEKIADVIENWIDEHVQAVKLSPSSP